MATYLITGCGRGIGLPLTRRLLERGDEVIGSVRGGDPPIRHERLQTVRFDVRDADAIELARDGVEGPVDVLVDDAGTSGRPADRARAAGVDDKTGVLDKNDLWPLHVTHAFLLPLRRSNNPKVMVIIARFGGLWYSPSVAHWAAVAARHDLMQGMADG